MIKVFISYRGLFTQVYQKFHGYFILNHRRSFISKKKFNRISDIHNYRNYH